MNNEINELRKKEEMEFHDEVERYRKEHPEDYENHYSNTKFYAVSAKSRKYVDLLFSESKGKTVLDYCCGAGNSSIRFASKYGAIVTGIDLSEGRVAAAEDNWKLIGGGGLCSFMVMDAEHLTFPNDTFDYIYCCGVLHHLDLDVAFRELKRVLKPTGKIICVEALMHNPVFQAYRRRTPHLRTAWETEHILTRRQILDTRKHFSGLSLRFFHLISLVAVPFRMKKGFNTLLLYLILLTRWFCGFLVCDGGHGSACSYCQILKNSLGWVYS